MFMCFGIMKSSLVHACSCVSSCINLVNVKKWSSVFHTWRAEIRYSILVLKYFVLRIIFLQCYCQLLVFFLCFSVKQYCNICFCAGACVDLPVFVS